MASPSAPRLGKRDERNLAKGKGQVGISCGKEFAGTAESEFGWYGWAMIMAQDTELVI
jgi:hypothetical protein